MSTQTATPPLAGLEHPSSQVPLRARIGSVLCIVFPFSSGSRP